MKRSKSKPAAPAMVRNDSVNDVESPTWGGRVMRLLGALRQDGWQSTLGGLGGRSDRGRPGSLTFVEQHVLSDYELNAAYRNLWLARRLCEARPEEALRSSTKPFGIEEDRIPEFMSLNYGGFHSEGALERALRMAELKGGAGIFVGYANVTSPEQLLEPVPDDIGEGPSAQPIAFLEVFDKFQLTAQERDADTYSPTYDQPTVWCVTGHRRSGMRFHASRLIKFKGAPLPSDKSQGATPEDVDWGDSVLQAVWADVQRYGVFWQSVAHLMQISSVGVVSIHGLIDMLASQNQDVARDRVELMNEAMSITRLFLLDASRNESYHREAVSFSDMPALLQEVQLATAGAFKMPATKLFGRAPAGMNATGESDMRNWYDEVQCYRTRQVKPGLGKLLAVTDGIAPEDIEFEPLWQPTEQETAATEKLVVDRYERLWTMGVATEGEIRKALYEGKPLEELMEGEPPEPPPDLAQPGQTDPFADPFADPEEAGLASLFDAIDKQDATAEQVEKRLAARLIRRLQADPDVLAEIAGPNAEVDDVKAHLISRAKEMLPSLSDVSGERKLLVKEVRQLKTFKAAIAEDVPKLAKTGAQYFAENERRSREALVDDPDKVNPIRLPGDKTGAATHLENKRRQKEGKAILQGPRGGRYYMSVGGAKVYV